MVAVAVVVLVVPVVWLIAGHLSHCTEPGRWKALQIVNLTLVPRS